MINFKEVETGGSFDSLPEKWYTIKVEEAELANTKNGPNTMIKVKFAIVSPAKFSKRKVWNNFNLGAKSLWALKVFLESAGIDPNSLGEVSEQTIADQMEGLVVDAYLEPTTTTTGNPSNNITNFRKVAGNDSTVAETADTKNINMFK